MTSPTNSTPSIPQLSAEEIERWENELLLHLQQERLRIERKISAIAARRLKRPELLAEVAT